MAETNREKCKCWTRRMQRPGGNLHKTCTRASHTTAAYI